MVLCLRQYPVSIVAGRKGEGVCSMICLSSNCIDLGHTVATGENFYYYMSVNSQYHIPGLIHKAWCWWE